MEGLAEQGSPEAPSIDDVMRVREEYKVRDNACICDLAPLPAPPLLL